MRLEFHELQGKYMTVYLTSFFHFTVSSKFINPLGLRFIWKFSSRGIAADFTTSTVRSDLHRAFTAMVYSFSRDPRRAFLFQYKLP